MIGSITLPANVAAAIWAGRCTTVWRPPSAALANVRPGWHLWVREPFALPMVVEHLAPLQAVERGVALIFPDHVWSADLNVDPQPGKLRPARMLPRAAHRMHLVIRAIGSAALGELTEDDCHAQDFASRAAFLAKWDEVRRDWGTRASQPPSQPPAPATDETRALVLEFTTVRDPVPAAITVARAPLSRKVPHAA